MPTRLHHLRLDHLRLHHSWTSRPVGRTSAAARLCVGLAAALTLGLAPAAGAIQFMPGSGDSLNTFQSGNPGSPFNTPGQGVDYDGVGSGDPHPGEIVVDGEIPNLCINGGDCSTAAQGLVDFGSDPIEFTLEAAFDSAAVALPGSGPFGFNTGVLTVTFTGTADGQPDLVLTDPTDSSVLLESNLVGGFLNGNPVAPLTAQAIFDVTAIDPQPNASAFAFFQTQVNGNAWEGLFSDGIGTLNDEGIAQTLISNFSPSFDAIAQDVIDNGVLPSLDAEANGFLFRLESSQFVIPEPGTAWLLAGGLAAMAARVRRRGVRGS